MEEEQEIFGLIPDTFDPRDVWSDEILGVDEAPLPTSYRIEGLLYNYQGSYPFCTSFAVTTMLEWHYAKAGSADQFSQQHLFFHSGGSKIGSSFRENLEVARNKGAIPYANLPMPDTKYGGGKTWYETMKPKALATPFEDVKKLLGYVRIGFSPELLKRAILAYGPLLIDVQAGKGNYYTGEGVSVPGANRNHAVLLVGWTPTHWIIFDSLAWVKKTNGYGTLQISYVMAAAYALTELPKDWKKVVEEVRTKEFQNALNHYGKPRNFEAEVTFAAKMLEEFKAFNNQSVLEASGRFWHVLINAGVYGGYGLTYMKDGKKMSGDLINDIYNWRRTGKHIFDLDQPRPEVTPKH